MKRLGAAPRLIAGFVLKVLFITPWLIVSYLFSLLYRFRIEGRENLPKDGPYIIVFPETGVISNLCSLWAYWSVLRTKFLTMPDRILSYAQEQLWSLPYIRTVMEKVHQIRPLAAHGAARLSLFLLEGYRVLGKRGIVILNPEGDMPYDGRPLPLGSGAAWLALRTGAPVVPLVWSAEVYDVWPRWQGRPAGRGRVRLCIGKPFQVADQPLALVGSAEVDQANARIRAALNALYYGPAGEAGWAGVSRLRGQPLTEIPTLRRAPGQADQPALPPVPLSSRRRGVANLLWRCPLCGQNDALLHQSKDTVVCQGCGARWTLRRVPGKDFRLELIQGPDDLVGLEMALSAWYDALRREFCLEPVTCDGALLEAGEVVYLWADDVALAPSPPNPLLERWDGHEPPKALPLSKAPPGRWTDIGHGRLMVTNRRLSWRGERGELDFRLNSVTAVSLWLVNTLGLLYGTVPYRFRLGHESGLKWLTYVGRAAQADGHKVTVSAL